ncbi:MAG: flagellar protein FlaG [Paenisporosarcina sp.]|nr:flagellar protein FlaG [Paenisporosarcina sp.]
MEVKNPTAIHFSKTVEPSLVKPMVTPAPLEKKMDDIEEKIITKEMIVNKVEGMNEFLEPTSTNVMFQLHEKLDIYYAQVIDSKTDEVIREIPNKKFLDMYASMAELAGLMVDEKL